MRVRTRTRGPDKDGQFYWWDGYREVPDARRFFQAPQSVTVHADQVTCVELYGLRFETSPYIPKGTVFAY